MRFFNDIELFNCVLFRVVFFKGIILIFVDRVVFLVGMGERIRADTGLNQQRIPFNRANQTGRPVFALFFTEYEIEVTEDLRIAFLS